MSISTRSTQYNNQVFKILVYVKLLNKANNEISGIETTDKNILKDSKLVVKTDFIRRDTPKEDYRKTHEVKVEDSSKDYIINELGYKGDFDSLTKGEYHDFTKEFHNKPVKTNPDDNSYFKQLAISVIVKKGTVPTPPTSSGGSSGGSPPPDPVFTDLPIKAVLFQGSIDNYYSSSEYTEVTDAGDSTIKWYTISGNTGYSAEADEKELRFYDNKNILKDNADNTYILENSKIVIKNSSGTEVDPKTIFNKNYTDRNHLEWKIGSDLYFDNIKIDNTANYDNISELRTEMNWHVPYPTSDSIYESFVFYDHILYEKSLDDIMGYIIENDLTKSLIEKGLSEIEILGHNTGSVKSGAIDKDILDKYSISLTKWGDLFNTFKKITINNFDLKLIIPKKYYKLNKLIVKNVDIIVDNTTIDIIDELELVNVKIKKDPNIDKKVIPRLSIGIGEKTKIVDISIEDRIAMVLNKINSDFSDYTQSNLSITNIHFKFNEGIKEVVTPVLLITGFYKASLLSVFINKESLGNRLFKIRNCFQVSVIDYIKPDNNSNVADILFEECNKITIINMNVANLKNDGISPINITNTPELSAELKISDSIFEKCPIFNIGKGDLLTKCLFDNIKVNSIQPLFDGSRFIDLRINNCDFSKSGILNLEAANVTISGKTKLPNSKDIDIKLKNKLELNDCSYISPMNSFKIELLTDNSSISSNNLSMRCSNFNVTKRKINTGGINKSEVYLENSFINCDKSLIIEDVYQIDLINVTSDFVEANIKSKIIKSEDFKIIPLKSNIVFSITDSLLSDLVIDNIFNNFYPINFKFYNCKGNAIVRNNTIKIPERKSNLDLYLENSPIYLYLEDKYGKTIVNTNIIKSNTGGILFNKKHNIKILFKAENSFSHTITDISNIEDFKPSDIGILKDSNSNIFYKGKI